MEMLICCPLPGWSARGLGEKSACRPFKAATDLTTEQKVMALSAIIFKDGREFNLAYLQGPDIISLLRDEVSSYTSAPFNVRIETEEASFFKIPRVEFWNYVNQDKRLQDYVKEYYRFKLGESLRQQQMMIMNGKTGAVCAFLCTLVNNLENSKKTDGSSVSPLPMRILLDSAAFPPETV